MNVYIFDLDGTLANVDHRLNHITNGNNNWASFYQDCVNDAPMNEVIELFNFYVDRGDYVFIMSGRSDEVETETVNWLTTHTKFDPDSERMLLIMRPHDNFETDADLKEGWLGALPDEYRESIKVVYDDRTAPVVMWRKNGLTCFQVAEGNF